MASVQNRAETENDVVLELRDVSVSFDGGNSKVLDGVDFDVRRGETVGIVGESGSGKSMFASSMLNAVEEPGRVTGEVTYHPQDGDPVIVTDLSESQLKKDLRWTDLTFVVQSAQSAFNPTMSIRDHFLETFNAHGHDKREGIRKAREIMEDLYLNPDQVLTSFPHQLSGGMKQRTLIALAVVLDPEVLIMDEPTAALDLLMQRAIISLLAEIKEKYDLTMVFVTHDLNLISVIADRLGVMYAFEFVEIAPTKDLLTNPSHPYTRMLLNSVPNISAPVDAMSGIDGQAPNPKEVPDGCRFHTRCPIADEECFTVPPAIEPLEEEHTAACFYEERSRSNIPLHINSEYQ